MLHQKKKELKMIKSQFFDEKQQKKCQENLCNYKVE